MCIFIFNYILVDVLLLVLIDIGYIIFTKSLQTMENLISLQIPHLISTSHECRLGENTSWY